MGVEALNTRSSAKQDHPPPELSTSYISGEYSSTFNTSSMKPSLTHHLKRQITSSLGPPVPAKQPLTPLPWAFAAIHTYKSTSLQGRELPKGLGLIALCHPSTSSWTVPGT